jgi:hypothetical protein
MPTRSILLLSLAVALSACEPKFTKVTIEGAPVCNGTTLKPEVEVNVSGPRMSLMQKLDGRAGSFPAKMEQGKEYELKIYKCASYPCDVPANLINTQKVTAPEAESGTLKLDTKGFPECEPAAPPPAPAPAQGAGDAGAAP